MGTYDVHTCVGHDVKIKEQKNRPSKAQSFQH
jgi:hypothetical protein